jgi:hypothetical protein
VVRREHRLIEKLIARMQFLVPASINRKSKNHPRHFEILEQHFCGDKWLGGLDEVTPGQWAFVIRGRGSRGLGRATAEPLGIESPFDLLSNDELAALRDKDGRILIDLGWEVLNPLRDVVAGLAATLADLDIDPARVFLFHSNLAAAAEFTALWRDVDDRPPPHSVEYPVGLALLIIHQLNCGHRAGAAKRQEQAARATADNRRSRLFVSFNGEVRPHRLYIGAALKSFGILDRGYFSLLYPKKKANEPPEAFRQRSLHWIEKLPRGREFAAAATALIDRLPITLDVAAVPGGNIETLAWESQDAFYYDNSRFTVVVDTAVFDNHSLFVTEKVLKPIMNHSPFLLIGSPGGIDLLRRYGFRTFEPHLRQCEGERPDAILTSALDEIERLAGLDEAQLAAFSRGVADACDHNAAHLWDGFPDLLKREFIACLSSIGQPLGA